MQKLSVRTKDFTDSVIRRMTRVSLRYGAVNLSQGFPDFEPPKYRGHDGRDDDRRRPRRQGRDLLPVL